MTETYEVKLITWVRIDADNRDEAGEKAIREFRENPSHYPVEIEKVEKGW